MLVCSIGVLGTWIAIAWVIHATTDTTRIEAGGIAFAIIWVGCLVGLVAGWLHGLRHRGSPLLDCGGHPTRWLFLMNAVIFFTAGVLFAAGVELIGRFDALFAFSFAAYWLLIAAGRLGVHENGLWTYFGLVRWDRIRRYSWAADGTLLLKTTGPFFLLRGAIPVPVERLENFKKLMEQRVPIASPK